MGGGDGPGARGQRAGCGSPRPARPRACSPVGGEGGGDGGEESARVRRPAAPPKLGIRVGRNGGAGSSWRGGPHCPRKQSSPEARPHARGLERKGGRGSSGKLCPRRRWVTGSPRRDATRPALIPAWRGARPASAARGRPGAPTGTAPPPADSAAPRPPGPPAPPAGPSFPPAAGSPSVSGGATPSSGPVLAPPFPLPPGGVKLARRRGSGGGGDGGRRSLDDSQRQRAAPALERKGGFRRWTMGWGVEDPPHRPGHQADLATPGPVLQERRPGEGQKSGAVLWSLSRRATLPAGPRPLVAPYDINTTSQRR